jgi:cell division septation protein DedD
MARPTQTASAAAAPAKLAPPTAQPATTSATPVASTTPAAAGGDYLIQIASLPSEADAQKSYKSLSAKFGSVIGGRGMDIKAADLPGKGTYYRVRIPAGSKEAAVSLCERYRSAGGSCMVVR